MALPGNHGHIYYPRAALTILSNHPAPRHPHPRHHRPGKQTHPAFCPSLPRHLFSSRPPCLPSHHSMASDSLDGFVIGASRECMCLCVRAGVGVRVAGRCPGTHPLDCQTLHLAAGRWLSRSGHRSSGWTDGRTERVKEREGWIDGEVKEERDTETD